MIAAICARADVWLRRAVRMAGEVTDRALRIPYVKGTVAFRQYFSPSPLCRPAVSPRERSEGVRPASLARIFLITVQSGVTGNYSEDGDKDRARCRLRDDQSRHTHPAYALRPRWPPRRTVDGFG